MSVLKTAKNSGGRKALFEFTQGIDVDARLAPQEVRVQQAWARALGRLGTLRPGEVDALVRALDEALALIEQGRFEWKVEDEDVHMNLERFMVERVGEPGKRIHLGRSRNDLIATSLRLYVRDTLLSLSVGVRDTALALASQARSQVDVLAPGMTHLQAGQPVRFGHVLAAHGWALARDLRSLEAAAARAVERMPLGSAALAGTTLAIDLPGIARELGFAGAPANSYDAVGDRDFVLEALSAISLAGLHLSRLSEDLVIWSSTPYGLVKLPPAWSTGSSIMPNKRNPDVPELVRAHSAHLTGALMDAHALVKGLPTSYASDLHELKGVYMRAFDGLAACLGVLPHFIAEMGVDPGAAGRLLRGGHLLATEVANHLAEQGVPFREAYAQVASLVAAADQAGVQIERLERARMLEIAPRLDGGFLERLSFESAVEARSNAGGTARARVLEGIEGLERACAAPPAESSV